MNWCINPLNTELNSICHFLALLGAHRILHVSKIRVKELMELKRMDIFNNIYESQVKTLCHI
jgi:hypothetical protein